MTEIPGAGWATTVYGPKSEMTPLVGGAENFDSTGFPPAGPLNVSTNVILHYRLESLTRMSTVNFALAVLTLGHVAINVVMIIFNPLVHFDSDCGDPDSVYVARCGSPGARARKRRTRVCVSRPHAIRTSRGQGGWRGERPAAHA